MFRWILIILLLVAILAGLTIGVLNPDAVEVDLLIAVFSMPLGALLMLVAVLGVVIGLLLSWFLFVIPARLIRGKRGKSSSSRQLTPGRDV